MKHRRLARLAHARKLLEERESLDLEGKRRRLEAADDRLQEVRRAMNGSDFDPTCEPSAHDLRMNAAWRAGLASEEVERLEEVAAEARRVEISRLNLLQAHRDRRVAETAHDRARREWRLEQEQLGQKTSDALATARYARSGGDHR